MKKEFLCVALSGNDAITWAVLIHAKQNIQINKKYS